MERWMESILTIPFWFDWKILAVLGGYIAVEFLYLLFTNQAKNYGAYFTRSGIWDLASLVIGLSSLGYILNNWIFLGLPASVYSFVSTLKFSTIEAIPYSARLLLAVFFYDFLSYWRHRFFHSHPIWWTAHNFHHSAVGLTALSNQRSHPIQNFFSNAIAGFPLAILLQINVYDSIYFLVFSNFIGFFQHGKIDTSLGWLGRHVLVTPRFHHLHHAIERSTHANFGELFVFWDKLFGTYRAPDVSIHKIQTGIEDNYFEKDNMIFAFFKTAWLFYREIFLFLFSYFPKKTLAK